jgi:hypothetical protein
MSWWFLADVVIRVPVQVSLVSSRPSCSTLTFLGLLRREGMANGRSKDVVPRHYGLPLVNLP